MTDWNKQASLAAEHAHDLLFRDHRGVMQWIGATAVFGNDGYRQDERSRLTVDILRQHLSDDGIAAR